MLHELSTKLEVIFKKLRGQGKLTESNIRQAMRDIRRVLLEADVNFTVVRQFIQAVEEKSMGTNVIESITPGQMIVKIVHDELISLLGGISTDFHIKKFPEIIMVCGLQGSGKTTTVVKLASYLRKQGKVSLVSSVDIHRPAAIEQLSVLARNNNIPFFFPGNEATVETIVQSALHEIQSQNVDVFIMDTAGRLHIDDRMMTELSEVRDLLKPDHVVFVADGMTGQDAVTAVQGFMRYVTFDGVILTKMDGDTRGGAALSIREVTGKPILFIGTGERIDAFECFHPDRFASRILGMGDIVSLVEKAQEFVDAKKAQELQKKVTSASLSFEDFLDQLRQIKKMGSLTNLMALIPGMNKMAKNINFSDDEIKRVEAVILSMTKQERRHPSIIDGSRRRRIAFGSGTTVHEVNNIIKQFHTLQKMMKQMSHMTGRMKSIGRMRLPV